MIEFDQIILSDEECEQLINQANANGLTLATVTTGELHYRTSHLCVFMPGSSPVIDFLYSKISDITGCPLENIEYLQINRYMPGEYFKPHHDWLPSEYTENSGGQRTFTFLLYLNRVLAGGETNFPHLVKKITPKPGRAIVWRNCIKGTSELDQLSLHESLPVLEGEKWMLVTWVRERAHVPNSVSY